MEPLKKNKKLVTDTSNSSKHLNLSANKKKSILYTEQVIPSSKKKSEIGSIIINDGNIKYAHPDNTSVINGIFFTKK